MRLTLPQQRSQETRQRILAAGRVAFARKGYGQATVEDVALEAGISKGAMYHHFSSKEELFRALFDEHLASSAPPILEKMEGASSFREAIELMVGAWLSHRREEAGEPQLSTELWAQASREPWAREVVARFHAEVRAAIVAVLRGGQKAGFIRADLDAEATAAILVGLFDGLYLEWIFEPDIDHERLKAPLCDLIGRFISAGSDQARGDRSSPGAARTAG